METKHASTSRIPSLPANDVTREDMATWFKAMAARGLLFHPEDDPAGIIATAGAAEHLFTPAECTQLRTITTGFFARFGDAVCEEALAAGEGAGNSVTKLPVTAVLLLSPSPSVDMGPGDEFTDGLDVFAVRWDRHALERIRHLSALCRAHDVTCITAPIDMWLIGNMNDDELRSRVLESREGGGEGPVVVSWEKWARDGALFDDADTHETPRLEVTPDNWRVTCEERATGLLLVSDRVPLAFDPVASFSGTHHQTADAPSEPPASDVAPNGALLTEAIRPAREADGRTVEPPCTTMAATGHAWALWLATCGNPDFGQDPDRPLYTAEPAAFVLAHSPSDCVAEARTFIDDNGLGGGNWLGGQVYDVAGELVGYVSYNGRVRALDPDSAFATAIAQIERPPTHAPTRAPGL